MFVGAVHLVADRLKWFGDEESDVETILAAKGEKVLRSLTGKQCPLAAVGRLEDFCFIDKKCNGGNNAKPQLCIRKERANGEQ